MLLTLLLLQATPAPADAGALRDFDLAKLPHPSATPACATGGGQEIVVCGAARNRDDQRVDATPEVETVLPRADFGLFGAARMSVFTKQVMVGSFPSNRVMVGVTFPF